MNMSQPTNGTVTNNGINITYTNNGTGGVDSFIATYTASTGQTASVTYTINVTPFTVSNKTIIYGSVGVQSAIEPTYSSGGPAVSISQINGTPFTSPYTTSNGNRVTLGSDNISIIFDVIAVGVLTDTLILTFVNQYGATCNTTYTIEISVTPFIVNNQTVNYNTFGNQSSIAPTYSSGGPATSITNVGGAILNSGTTYTTTNGNTFTINGINIVFDVLNAGTYTDTFTLTFINSEGLNSTATYNVDVAILPFTVSNQTFNNIIFGNSITITGEPDSNHTISSVVISTSPNIGTATISSKNIRFSAPRVGNEISNTATFVATYTATTGQTATATYTVNLLAPDTITFTASTFPYAISQALINNTSLSYAVVASSSDNLSLTYAVTSGTLPSGLTMDSSGNITGTPTDAWGTAINFTVTASDAVSSATQNITGTIKAFIIQGTETINNGTATYSMNISIYNPTNAAITWNLGALQSNTTPSWSVTNKTNTGCTVTVTIPNATTGGEAIADLVGQSGGTTFVLADGENLNCGLPYAGSHAGTITY